MEFYCDKKASIYLLETMLEKYFYPSTVAWILEHYAMLDMQSWQLVSYLEQNPMPRYQRQALIVQHFVVLRSEDFPSFIDHCEVTLPWMLKDGIFFAEKNIETMRQQERLSSKEFAQFCLRFGQTDQLFRKQHREAFISIPMKHWVAKLEEIKSVAHV